MEKPICQQCGRPHWGLCSHGVFQGGRTGIDGVKNADLGADMGETSAPSGGVEKGVVEESSASSLSAPVPEMGKSVKKTWHQRNAARRRAYMREYMREYRKRKRIERLAAVARERRKSEEGGGTP